MWGIGTWFAKIDQFGSSAKFNYRREAGYGTSYGGCLTLFLSLATFLLITVQLVGFLFYPSYNQ